jgi:hypothetical protein
MKPFDAAGSNHGAKLGNFEIIEFMLLDQRED